MTVAELIARLSELDPSMRVVVNGYECGFDVVCDLRIITVRPWQPINPSQLLSGWLPEDRWSYEGELSHAEPGEQSEQVVCFPRKSC